jgi:hypothetical protein
VLTTALDLLAIALLAAFAYFIWWPLMLAVIGAGCLVASWRIEAAKRARR